MDKNFVLLSDSHCSLYIIVNNRMLYRQPRGQFQEPENTMVNNSTDYNTSNMMTQNIKWLKIISSIKENILTSKQYAQGFLRKVLTTSIRP